MSIMSWLGVALAAVGAFFLQREHGILRQCQIVKGQVIELVMSRGSKGGVNYAPRISFRTLEGKEIVFTTAMKTSYPGVNAGDQVDVAYLPATPQEARLLRFGYRFGAAYVVVGLGLLLLFIGYGFKHGDQWIREAYLPAGMPR